MDSLHYATVKSGLQPEDCARITTSWKSTSRVCRSNCSTSKCKFPSLSFILFENFFAPVFFNPPQKFVVGLTYSKSLLPSSKSFVVGSQIDVLLWSPPPNCLSQGPKKRHCVGCCRERRSTLKINVVCWEGKLGLRLDRVVFVFMSWSNNERLSIASLWKRSHQEIPPSPFCCHRWPSTLKMNNKNKINLRRKTGTSAL